MRFWQKNCIINIIILGLLFNISSFLFLDHIFQMNLKREINRALLEHKNMYISLKAMDQNIWIDLVGNKSYEEFLIGRWIGNFEEKTINFEILNEDKDLIAGNFDFGNLSKRKELKALKLNRRNYIIREVDKKTYIFVSSNIILKNRQYIFSCAKNIQSLYDENFSQILFLLKMNIAITIILVGMTYISSKYLMRPIKALIESSTEISKGSFENQIEVVTSDELGILTKNFNKMSNSLKINFLKMQEMINERERFIRNFTHEIKTPLTSIIGYSDFLRRIEYDQKNFSKSLEYIYNEGKRLELLRSKMMDLILSENNKAELELGSVKEKIEIAIDSMRLVLKEKDIQIEIIGFDFEIKMEKNLFVTMITNIIDNSIRASDNHSKIVVKLIKNERKIEIIDYGIGIERSKLAKIKEPFFVGDASRKKKDNGGFGLGLSIVEQIVRIHFAKIEIESEINKGTSIRILF